MKKQQLSEILLNINIPNNILKYLTEIKGLNAHLFCRTCINNKNVINEENIGYIVGVFSSLNYIDDKEKKMEFYKSLNNLLDNDYVTSSIYFNDILKRICELLDYPIYETFSIGIEEKDYYIMFLIKQYIDLFSNLEFYDYDVIYEHSFTKLSTIYLSLLDDLINTEVDKGEDYIDNCLERVKLFVSLAKDKNIFTLDDKKYKSVILVGSTICNIKELSKFKRRVKLLSRDLSLKCFKEKIDTYSSEFSLNTLNILFNKLGKGNNYLDVLNDGEDLDKNVIKI